MVKSPRPASTCRSNYTAGHTQYRYCLSAMQQTKIALRLRLVDDRSYFKGMRERGSISALLYRTRLVGWAVAPV